jgi:hypothetical protein
LQLVGKPPHLFGIHDCLGHNFPFVGLQGDPRIWRLAGKNLTWKPAAAESFVTRKPEWEIQGSKPV